MGTLSKPVDFPPRPGEEPSLGIISLFILCEAFLQSQLPCSSQCQAFHKEIMGCTGLGWGFPGRAFTARLPAGLVLLDPDRTIIAKPADVFNVACFPPKVDC